MSLYAQRGVSAQKEEVHAAIQNINQGLYPYAFCKMYPDYLGADDNWVNLSHADGAGTKSIIAYLYWRETGDTSVWAGIAQDAVAMNLDDLLCVGIHNNFLFSSTIDRNKSRISGEVLKAVIDGTQACFDMLKKYGVDVHYLGGETADVGDVVRTIAVNGTMTARWPKEKLITNENISEGDVIVGFASSGKAVYEHTYNSGIGSNGLTSARHDVLAKTYAEKYPETFEATLSDSVVYIGPHQLTDEVPVTYNGVTQSIAVAHLLLSPTRTYAPLVKLLLEQHFSDINGMIHCSGGGQTKCMKYLPKPLKIVKDHLFTPPTVFEIIQASSGATHKEMYEVFNMGHRLEVYTNAIAAENMIAIAASLGIEAQVIGRVEASARKQLVLKGDFGVIEY